MLGSSGFKHLRRAVVDARDDDDQLEAAESTPQMLFEMVCGMRPSRYAGVTVLVGIAFRAYSGKFDQRCGPVLKRRGTMPVD